MHPAERIVITLVGGALKYDASRLGCDRNKAERLPDGRRWQLSIEDAARLFTDDRSRFLTAPHQGACLKQRRSPVHEGSHLGAEMAVRWIKHVDGQGRGLPGRQHGLQLALGSPAA